MGRRGSIPTRSVRNEASDDLASPVAHIEAVGCVNAGDFARDQRGLSLFAGRTAP